MTGDFAAECWGKEQFRSWPEAERAAKRLNRRHDKSKGNVYKCPNTRHFHVGNSAMGKYKKRRPSRHSLKEYAKNDRKKFSV